MPIFGGLKGNVHASFMARWNACGRLPISANWTFFRQLSRLRRYERILVKILLLKKGVGHYEHKFQEERGRPQRLLVSEKLKSPWAITWCCLRDPK